MLLRFVLQFLLLTTFTPKLLLATVDVLPDKISSETFYQIEQVLPVEQMIKIGKNNPHLMSDLITLFNSEVGYTLIGVKPVSFYEEGSSISQELLLLLEKQFSFSKEIIFKVSNARRGKEICIIHKNSFRKCVLESKELKDFILNEFTSVDEFFHRFKQSSLPLRSFCNCTGQILGTMLGFGAKNAENWSHLSILDQFLKSSSIRRLTDELDPGMIALPDFSVAIPNSIRLPTKNLKFQSFYDEWKYLEKGKKGTGGFIPPYWVYLPEFIFWNEQEDSVQRFVKARDVLGEVLTTVESITKTC
jgi:hypothetical protein